MASPTPLVGSIRCLTNKKNHEEAMQILRRLATMVHPILKARTWRVGTLEEFFPGQVNLLGMNTNRGAKIQIRLRPAHAPDSFYPFDDLIGTMLHEMTHIVHGPHNVAFYNLLKALNLEYDRLLDSGYKGQGFDAPGQRLGRGSGAGLRHGNLRDDRVAALQAAEKRRRLNEMMLPAGGVRLGGGAGGDVASGRKKDLDEINWEQWHRPGELAVMAAERRARDRVWCGTEDEDRQATATTAAAAEEVSTLSPATRNPTIDRCSTSSDAGSSSKPMQTFTQSASGKPPSNRRVHGKTPPSTRASIAGSKRKATEAAEETTSTRSRAISPKLCPDNDDDMRWSCPQCTLINKPLALQCDCCLAIRPLNH